MHDFHAHRRPGRARILLLLLTLVFTGLATWTTAAPAVAAPCDAPVVSPVACENTKVGTPETVWGINGAGDANIQGFATDISVDQGGTVGFKVDTNATSYRLDIYRMGFYNGDGARFVTTVLPTVLNNQPNCITAAATGLVDCGNWTQNASWQVPADAVSGIYFAHAVRTDGTAGESHIMFVVRDDDGRSNLLFQTSDTTWQAYNTYGGNSLYTGSPAGRAYKVSYNRPFTTRANAPEDWVFNAEYPMVRFLESNGYDVSYTTGVDTDRRGNELTEHKTFLSVGHDEYWSGTQRTNVELARAAGVNLAFFSGNEVFWKTRWENSIDGSGTPHRTLVSYKETHANAKIDPAGASTWTGTWRDPRFSPPGDGGRPENALTGTIFTMNCCAIDMQVGASDGKMRFWRNTRVANLTGNQTTTVGTNTIGYEWDEDLDNGSRPAGAFRVSETDGSGQRITDQGTDYSQGPGTHAMTMYRAPSGALVFGAGTIQWSWGLDSRHDRGSAPADVAAQQATVNLLADMGAQPTTMRPGLVAAAASTDTVAPTSTITSPAAGATVEVGTPLTVTGTAADTGGGRVGGVEVSTDNGTTWHRATGRESWTYTFTPSTNGSLTIRTRATDDSARTQVPGAGTTITVGAPPTACPCSIWPGTATPQRTDSDTDAVELGVKFRASTNGLVTGIRYYKPVETSGTHVGSLWSSTGTRLANVTFTNESASGWQQATFPTPVAVTAGTTYVASYFTPSRYAVSSAYFTSATTRGPLTALANGTDGGNGLYRYTSTAGAFPNLSFNSENYWVDVVFSDTDTTKPTVSARTPAVGATGVAVGVAPTATFSETVQQATVAFQLTTPGGAVVPATTSYDAASRTATLNPSAALAASTTYTARVSGAKDTAGNTMDPVTWTFTTGTADTTKPTVTARTPAVGATGVSVGVAPTATFSEAVQQSTIAFELRTPGGAVVPSTTAYNASTRVATLTPNAALAGTTTYTVNLTGARDPSNNLMDPVTWTFTTETPDTTKPTVTARTPAPAATGVPVATEVTATFSEAVQQSTIAFELRTPGGAVVPSTTAYNATTRVATLTPTGSLNPSTTYTVNLTGAKDPSGNTMDPLTWTFTTLASSYGCPCSIWAPTATPARTDSDTDSVELGVKFRAATNGFVTGIRYYKPVETSGTHVGSLWSSTGTRLATVNFTNESASGWQEATFTTPVAVTAGTTYVASYFTPTRYAVTSAYFTSATTRGPLTALANGTDGGNGLYRYSSTAGVFPNQSFNSENYWVDVVFADNDTTKPTVTTRTPAPGATNVVLGATPTAVFDEAVDPASIAFELRTSGGTLVPSTTAYNAGSRTATLTPDAALAASTTYTVNLSGARDPAGNVMNAISWTFTTEAPDTTKPTVTSTNPAAGAPSVLPGTDVSGVFSEAVQQSTITVELRNPANALVAGTTAYNAGTRTVTLTPNAALASGTTYTATISGAKDVSGNTMNPFSWTFTTSSSTYSCPCTIFPSTATPERTDADTSSVELGVKFRAATNGYITGIRYYKPAVTTGTHVGSLWTSTGTRLGQVTFTNETASGWQQATFASPIAVTAGTTYVASYFTPSRYVVSSAYFAPGAVTRGPLTALAHSEGGNGVYRYTGSASTFPDNTYQGENYWVDVVFSETSDDGLPPTVTTRVPAAGTSGVSATVRPSATFSEGVVAGSISMVLRNSATSAVVASTTSYDSTSLTATLTPSLQLAYSTPFTVTLSGARDPSGNVMAPVTWSFETAAAPPPPPTSGPGGPIALVTSDANKSSTYLLEIARAEGLNEYANLKNTDLSATTLAPYSAVVLGNVAITDTQVTALTSWVNAGGNLVLMRPDSRLNSLAGLVTQTGTVSNGYLKVATSTEAGAGITSDTMQFHGAAQRYSLTGGATSVAELFTTASAGTGQPAVSLRTVGSSGGQVASFTYDLAQSIIQTRQGNPAWAGTERDGTAPIRSNDMFFGAGGTDWVDLTKVSIPQADEQQRLLANLLTVMTRDKMPLPRFWYLPATHKAVVVATGDDHGTGGTAGRLSTYTAAGAPGCSVAKWECPRFTSYIYPNSPLINNEAAAFTADGFEIAVHPENGCTNFTSLANLQSVYNTKIAEWSDRYDSIPAPTTGRFHCMAWSDWASQPKAELAAGIRFDTNYYYWPGSWIANRPGFMTGSGFPMRFTDTDGSMIDVFQSSTMMTDESGQSYPFTPDTLLDRALGSQGYYGAFTANLHTDNQTTFEDTQVLASAQSRGVPVVSSKQMLTWLDGRNASSFSNISYSGNTMSFTVNVGAGANQLTSMLPTSGPGGRTLTTITRGGTAVPITLMTVKGQQYAMFAAASGAHTATYVVGGTPTIAEAQASAITADSAKLTWQTDEPATSAVLLGTDAGSMKTVDRVGGRTGDHAITLDSLQPGRRYVFRVRSTSADGTVVTWPALDQRPASFTTRSLDRAAPRISGVRVAALPDGTARVTWSTDEPATSTVRFGRGTRLGSIRLDDRLTRDHAVVLTGLDARRAYGFRVSSADETGNTAHGAVRRLRTARHGVGVQTLEAFRTGTWTSGLVLDDSGFGSLTLAGRGSATYTSGVVDSGQKVDWLRAVLHGTVPAGTSATLQVRTGATSKAGASWSAWTSPRTNGDPLKRSGRFLQWRLRLTASGTAVPDITGIGFTNTGTHHEESELH
ncbi:DUF4082 domain-containing protein [Nocardioides currus]|uniref:Fibronectin type-III domain-containing protein n=1 Tax=Nocardioides currus TaxID=2133958 RepID=A0A2R7YWH9_9ACTN|nr:DUF4082 domain-containing protein [Nocardioides currus]PUA80728.1 hypothetical protein C7S10_13345 [Nocardioides currus]